MFERWRRSSGVAEEGEIENEGGEAGVVEVVCELKKEDGNDGER